MYSRVPVKRIPALHKLLNYTGLLRCYVGFTELEENGHIDCLYCNHQWQGKGIGSSLLKTIEIVARRQGISRLFAEVSISACGFFQKMGFSVEGEQIITLRGEKFKNLIVSKCISS